jgi:formate-dependent phosphoribosylglycinamide formyltransferase (GAR transformylase)
MRTCVQTARNKYEVRRAMVQHKLKTPRFALIDSADAIKTAAQTVGFPAFLKPVYGVQVCLEP